ncbi:S1 family peptidase [Colwellia ponticola]|uniref:Trypsin-like peptidase domain-containing protein n=1 Tax=Colwellia ponticola TaxID=2304625 RepID=A0A8H2JJX7_9GAMM|nr:serine protease [Colwellia ponticola]TMM43947.1 trypsin-like peptidase domain-containing protein [Colwellia ponticola]
MKVFFTLVFIVFSSTVFATEQAQTIFAQLTPALYQIKLIDKASGEKSSIGSAFQISKDGIIATNYHVISSYARNPEKYRIEYLDYQGNTAQVTLMSVDVINDLALVKRVVNADMPYFRLAKSPPIKGEKLFALGNPHDLGMIVVPGTYNGLKKESFNERIHFTGAINSGMSGGPVVNKDEQVVGINVATSGNQIGFLVPHDKLVTLFTDYKSSVQNRNTHNLPANIKQQMTTQLFTNQNKLMTTLLNSPWPSKALANKAMIPIIEVPFIRCWGDSNADKTDALILSAIARCSLDENTYLSSHFFTGSIEIEFSYMQAKSLSNNKFYHLYQKHIARASSGNRAGKNDVSEYQCHHDVVTPSSTANTAQTITNKSVFCTRAYQDFPGLFDVLYLGASIDKNQQALVSHFTLAGVSQENAMKFTGKFMEAVSWK